MPTPVVADGSGDDGIEAFSIDDDLVKLVGPMEGRECLNVCDFEFPFVGLALLFFGGVPRRISYDNSKIAVARIVGSRKRKVTTESCD